ncbi:MAG: hypothetical protein KC620_10765 [Myxococcales bacterium]|nr:hypothetical protein [Myxococcales bacterium]
MRHRFVPLALTLSAGLFGCKSEPAPPPAEPKPAAAAPVDLPIPPRITGTVEPDVLDEVTLPADAVEVIDDAVYVRVPVPADPARLIVGPVTSARLFVPGERRAVAVPASEGRVPDRPWLYVRFTSAAPAPDPFVVEWHQPALLEGEPGRRQAMRITGAPKARPFEGLNRRFFRAAGRWFREHAPVNANSFWAYAASRLGWLAARGHEAEAPAPTVRVDPAMLMAVPPPRVPLEFDLQFERGQPRAPAMDEETQPPDGLPVPTVSAHPWDELIAATGRVPQIEPLSAYAPADVLYLHFTRPAVAGAVFAAAADWVAPIAQALTLRPGDADWFGRAARQLALDGADLSKAGVAAVAVLVADPAVPDAAEVTLLLQVADAPAVEAAIAAGQARAQAWRADAKTTTYPLGDLEVQRFATVDRAVSQHRATLVSPTRTVIVLSNSRRGIERVQAARADGQTLALADDFRGFRAHWPAGEAGEDGFAFFGRAALTALISPQARARQSRFLNRRADVRALQNAALLYGWLEGRRPASAADLVAKGLIDVAGILPIPGKRMAFDPTQGAHAEDVGGPVAWTPASELPVDGLTELERGVYGRFAESWRAEFEDVIEPIGVRLTWRPDGGRLVARMMPLDRKSTWHIVARLLGDATLGPPTEGDGLRLQVAMAGDSDLRGALDTILRDQTGQRDVNLGFIGGTAELVLGDHDSLWDAVVSIGELPGVEGRRVYRDPDLRRSVIRRLPLTLTVAVRDPLALNGALLALHTYVSSELEGLAEWSAAGEHRGAEITRVRETITENPEAGIMVEFAQVGDTFIASLNHQALLHRIDEVLDGHPPAAGGAAAKKGAQDGAQARFTLRPASAKKGLGRALLGLFETFTVPTEQAARLASEVLYRGLGPAPVDAIARRDRALAWLGVRPVIPQGGTFSLLPDGQMGHSLYGTPDAPSWPDVPIQGAPMTRLIEALGSLSLSLHFEGPEAARAMELGLTWQTR